MCLPSVAGLDAAGVAEVLALEQADAVLGRDAAAMLADQRVHAWIKRVAALEKFFERHRSNRSVGHGAF